MTSVLDIQASSWDFVVATDPSLTGQRTEPILETADCVKGRGLPPKDRLLGTRVGKREFFIPISSFKDAVTWIMVEERVGGGDATRFSFRAGILDGDARAGLAGVVGMEA